MHIMNKLSARDTECFRHIFNCMNVSYKDYTAAYFTGLTTATTTKKWIKHQNFHRKCENPAMNLGNF